MRFHPKGLSGNTGPKTVVLRRWPSQLPATLSLWEERTGPSRLSIFDQANEYFALLRIEELFHVWLHPRGEAMSSKVELMKSYVY